MSEPTVAIPRRVYEGTVTKIAELQARVEELEAERDSESRRAKQYLTERDEARTRLTFIHLLDGLEPDGLLELGRFFAERTRRGEE